MGRGLASAVLMHTARRYGLSFCVVGDPTLSLSSRVAAGLWNPVVFKRLSKSWMAHDLVPFLKRFYSDCENNTSARFVTERSIIKPFTQEQEKKLWQLKADKELRAFLDPSVHNEDGARPEGLHCEGDFGIVHEAGNLDVAGFIDATEALFADRLHAGRFIHNNLKIDTGEVQYGKVRARAVVFCEGYLVKDNPYFSWIPLKPAKGELLEINAPGVKLNRQVFYRDGFLLDTEGGFRLGSTYTWEHLDDGPTPGGLEELEAKARKMIKGEWNLKRHLAGVRPASPDRRPLIGRHPRHRNLYVFNGLGAKGVMLAPWFCEKFVLFYLQKQPLHPEVNLERYYHLYEQNK